jgi:hypothetical protein
LILTRSQFFGQMRRLGFALAIAGALVALAASHARADCLFCSPSRPPVLAIAERYLGARNFTGFREAWCADALNVWLRKSGHRPQRSHRAVDFARYGRPTAPRIGAIAVMRHHVGIVAGFARGGVILLSGNHRRRVGLGVYSLRRFIAFREPVR